MSAKRLSLMILIPALLKGCTQRVAWSDLASSPQRNTFKEISWEEAQKRGLQRATIEAKSGSPEALYSLAGYYRYGRGTEQNVPAAISLYKLAARKGSVPALQSLESIYRQGIGVQRNDAVAEQFRQLAEAQKPKTIQPSVAWQPRAGEPNLANDVMTLMDAVMAASYAQCKNNPAACQNNRTTSEPIRDEAKEARERDQEWRNIDAMRGMNQQWTAPIAVGR